MSYFGSEMLNSKIIESAMKKDIPVCVKNAFDLGTPGTLVVQYLEKAKKNCQSNNYNNEGISRDFRGSSMFGKSGVAAEVLKTLGGAGIKALMISQSSYKTYINFSIKCNDFKGP